jgi:MoxR-like ATPase
MAKNNSESPNAEYAEFYDIPRMTIGEIKDELKMNFTDRIYRGVFCIVGEAGLGKSQAVHQAARELGARVSVIFTAQFGLLGAGVPSVKDVEEGFFKIKLPTVFPKKGERSIVLFDEINMGQQHAISMFFSVIEDRRIYDYRLPDDCLVVAIMNPATESYSVQQIENNAALRRRLKFVYAIHSTEEWLNHARTREFHYSDRQSPVVQTPKVRDLYSNNPELAEQLNLGMPCHEHVRSFIGTAPSMLYDDHNKKNNRPFACPASWQTTSLDCYALEYSGVSLTSSRALSRFGATLNMTTAVQFQSFIEDNNVILNPVEFLQDPKAFLKKFQEVEDAGKQPRLIEFVYNLLNYMFEKEYDVDKAYSALFLFFESCPAEYSALLTDNISSTATRYGKEAYRAKLINSFVKDKDRFRAHLRHSEKAHDAVDQFLRLNG